MEATWPFRNDVVWTCIETTDDIVKLPCLGIDWQQREHKLVFFKSVFFSWEENNTDFYFYHFLHTPCTTQAIEESAEQTHCYLIKWLRKHISLIPYHTICLHNKCTYKFNGLESHWCFLARGHLPGRRTRKLKAIWLRGLTAYWFIDD